MLRVVRDIRCIAAMDPPPSASSGFGIGGWGNADSTSAIVPRPDAWLGLVVRSHLNAVSPHMTRERQWGNAAVVIAVLAMLVGLFGAAQPSSASSQMATSPVVQGLQLEQLPSSVLSQVTAAASNSQAIQGAALLQRSCNPYLTSTDAQHPEPCWFGDLKASRTIAIFGDSFVGNWVPALSLSGKALHFKVAVFEFTGCPTPLVDLGSPVPGFGLNHIHDCTTWHHTMPAAIQVLRPKMVIAASGTLSWGAAGDPAWILGLGNAFTAMSTPTNSPIRVLMGSSPHLPQPAASCLAAHLHSVQRCTYRYSPTGTGKTDLATIMNRDVLAGAQDHLNVINVVNWMCANDACPMVIGGNLVYADEDHTTIKFSTSMASALTAQISSLLQAG